MRYQSLILSLVLCGASTVAVYGRMQSEVEPSRAAVQPPIKQEMSGVRPDLLGDVVNANGAPVVGATVYVYTAKPRTGTSPF